MCSLKNLLTVHFPPWTIATNAHCCVACGLMAVSGSSVADDDPDGRPSNACLIGQIHLPPFIYPLFLDRECVSLTFMAFMNVSFMNSCSRACLPCRPSSFFHPSGIQWLNLENKPSADEKNVVAKSCAPIIHQSPASFRKSSCSGSTN